MEKDKIILYLTFRDVYQAISGVFSENTAKGYGQ